MMFVGSRPWHDLGVELPRNATWEETKAVLPFYTVEERPLYCQGLALPIPDRKALVASNDGRYLATVGADYGVVQFDQLAEAVMQAAGQEAVFHTAGLLGVNGARGWLLGELANPIRVANDSSEIRKYFLATSSHDGLHKVALVNAATRVVCQNTLGAALNEKGGGSWSIRHTSRAGIRVGEAVEAFKRMVAGYERFGELCNVMARTALTAEQRVTILTETFPLAADASEVTKVNAMNRRQEVLRLSESGTGVGSAMRGSAWALFQGMTEWADHVRPMRGTPTASEKFDGQLFGGAAEVKQIGLASILRSIKVAA
jgi:phage/plasmid-like protein (TIGR03299 family)